MQEVGKVTAWSADLVWGISFHDATRILNINMDRLPTSIQGLQGELLLIHFGGMFKQVLTM